METNIPNETKKEKEKLLNEFNDRILTPMVNSRSINGDKKKIVTYENLLRFYQNSIETFALGSHKHYTQDIVTDVEHRFVTDKQIEHIERFGKTTTATNEQIEALFIENK